MNEPTHVSTFAGIDGIGLGLERAGVRTIASVEIDRFCNRVRAKRRPDIRQFSDIRDFGHAPLAHAAGVEQPLRVDILSGGFPCQDLSVAGKRAGLAGSRSGLFYEFVRVARELQPTWLLVENVPGLLTSNEGRDFAIVLRELGDAGYFVEWRVLDSRWFGVPQRRRRVFIVGHLGGPSASPVLFESEGSGGHPAAGDTPREDIAGTLGFGAPGARGWRGDLDGSGAYIPFDARNGTEGDVVSTTLQGGGTKRGWSVNAQPTVYRKSARMNADPNSPETWVDDGIANTLNGFDVGDVRTTHAVVGISENQRGELRETDYSRQLTSGGGKPGQGYGAVRVDASVRRLTPTECERLQGFPDGWTCLCDQTPCKCPDGPRYAALGNAVTVNVAEWIGRRIVMAEL